MIVIGITGLVAAGKSTIIQNTTGELKAKNILFYHFDCDAECHKILGEGADRKAIANNVFKNKAELEALQKDLWFKLEKLFCAKLAELKASQTIVLLDAPLLFQAGFDKYANKIVFITAPELIREQRFLARNKNTTPQDFKNRNAIQQSYFDAHPNLHFDLVVDTNHTKPAFSLVSFVNSIS